MDKIVTFYNNLPDEVKTAIWTALGTIFSLLVALFVSILKWLNARAKLREAETEHQLKTLQLETDKATLENTLINGSYSICPKCGAKLLLSNMVFHNDKVKEGDVNGHEKKTQ